MKAKFVFEAIKHLSPKSKEEIKQAFDNLPNSEKLKEAVNLDNLSLFMSIFKEGMDIPSDLLDNIYHYWSVKENKKPKIRNFINENPEKFSQNIQVWKAIYDENFNKFKEALKKGGKLKSEFIPKIYHKPNFMKYIIENYNDTITDIQRRKITAKLNKKPLKEYPRGYKQWRIMELLDKGWVSRLVIIKLSYEISFGKGSFDPVTNASFWNEVFVGKDANGPEWLIKYTKKRKLAGKATPNFEVEYTLNDAGKVFLETLRKKFKDQKIKSYA